MKLGLNALLVGFLFGSGLVISGMTQPQNILNFLDIFGSWDPSLGFVMVGAIGTHALIYRFLKHRKAPLLDTHFRWPTKTTLDKKVIFGSLIFGMGWGLAGYCPGPALTSLGSLQKNPFLFVVCMILGMLLYRFTEKFIFGQKQT